MISKVAGDSLQLIAIGGGMVLIQAMVHVIVDEGALRAGDSLLNRLQLLGDIKAGLAFLDHADHRPKMPVGAFQTGNHGRMACVNMRLCHRKKLSSPGG